MDKETNQEMLQHLIEATKDSPVTHRYIKSLSPEEVGHFLFVGEGPDFVIHGMRYPDDALDLKKIPNLFPSVEKNTIIAGFPSSLIERAMMIVHESYEEDYQDAMWQKFLGLLLEAAVEILEGNEPPAFDVEKLL